MLGLFRKRILGIAHEQLRNIFPAAHFQHQRVFQTRLAGLRHNKQILERCRGHFLDVVGRSVFGLVRIYHLLTQNWINANTLQLFQKHVTRAAHERCNVDANWAYMYSLRCV